MMTIVMASARQGDADRPREVWGDVILGLASVALYAPDVDVVLAWKGPCEPRDLLDNPRLRVLRQPDECGSYGEAFGWAVEQSTTDELILMNDDAVLTPDTLHDLRVDAELIRTQHAEIKLGFLAARSNVAPGAQNIRVANGGALRPNGMRFDSEDRVLAAERVSPIVASGERSALDAVGGFPATNWVSDDLRCFDLRAKGYTNFVSRAYVHHVGMRSTSQGGVTEQDLLHRGQDWVREHRPDFWRAIGGKP